MTPTGKVERVWMDERRSVAVDEIGTGIYLGIESSIPLSLKKSTNVFSGLVTNLLQEQRNAPLLEHQNHQGQL